MLMVPRATSSRRWPGVERAEPLSYDRWVAALSSRSYCFLKLADASLFVLTEECNHRVSEIFPSLQIFRHPGIPLRNCSVHVRDVELA
jgi:hypothetical protein